MEKIPELNIEEQLKKDREELKEAGMLPKDSFPTGAGFMGAEVDLDAREAEEVKARKTGTADKKEKEPEFSPEELRAIQDTAYYIQQHRMSNDPERQKYWAKKYGLDENIFLKENIKKILSGKGEWNDEAQKFMQNWDMETAKKAFKNMKKAGEQMLEPDSGSKTGTLPDKTPMEDALKKQAKENQRQIDNVSIEDARMKGAENAEEARKMEFEAMNSLEALKADLEAKRMLAARYDVDMSGRWNKLKKVLGFNSKEIKDSGVEEKKNEYKQALKRYLDAKRESLGAVTKEQAAQLYAEFTVGEATLFLEAKTDESAKMRKERGEWPDKVMDGYMKVVDKWRGLSFGKKMAVSGALLAGGIVSGAYLGGIFVGLAATAKVGQRIVSGGATGVGLKKLMDTVSAKRENKAALEEAGKILSQDDWMKALNAKIDGEIGTIDTRIGKMESKDLTRKRVATFAGIFVGSGAMAQIINGTGLGGFIKDKASGVFGNVKHFAERILSPDQAYAAELAPAGGGTIATQAHEGLVGYGSEASGHEFVQAYPEGKYGLGLYGSEGEGHDLVDAHPEGKYGSGLYGTEGEGHEAMAVNPEEKSSLIGYGAEGDGHVADIRDIASVKIKAGGNMWGSIENNIKANPSAYGLDPNNPNFTKDMHRMTKQMLDEFAYRKGMSYEDLDQIARTKLRAGDTFKIIYNPTTEEISLDDFHGKAFGSDVLHGSAAEEMATMRPTVTPDVSHGGAAGAVHENTLNKPHLSHGTVKHGTGVAEHQPARGAGKTMQYDADTPEQINAKKEFALADKYQKDLRVFNAQETARLEGVNEAANDQLFSSTKEGIEKIFHESGISIRSNILDKPMNAWEKLIATENYITQDVQDADAVGKMNINLNKLKYLRLILGRYNTSGSETIGDCLKQAVKNPKILYLINKSVL